MIIIDKHKLLCPTCGSNMRPCKSINGSESSFWMECTSNLCNTYVDTYLPLDHQIAVHTDPHLYTGVFGGYGSGKTLCSLKDDTKHMLTTPNGVTVVGSAVLAQVEQTYERDFITDFPADFIRNQNKQKKSYTLINGHTLLIKSYYEEGLLRSLNVTRAHIVEASEVDHSIFTQLQSRLRNTEGTLPLLDDDGTPVYDYDKQAFKLKADWRKMIVESNPSAGWIREQFLLKSHKLFLNDSPHGYMVDEPHPSISSHVIPTKKNIYLPANFYEENAAGKARWWIRRYLEGSFDYAEGMVYPSVLSAFCDPFEIPKDWKRVIGWDYGIRDDTAIEFGAIDQKNGILYIFAEIGVNNMSYEDIAKEYLKEYPRLVPKGTLWRLPVMDGRSINKRNDFNLKTIGDMFKDAGIFLEPAQMSVEARMLKVNTMIENGTLKIFNTCNRLRKEIMNYKFPERTIDGKMKPGGEKPVDKNNHYINAMEFLVMEVPEDLRNIQNKAYDEYGNEYSKDAISYYNKVNKNQNPYYYDPFTENKRKANSNMDELFGVNTGGLEDISW